MIEARVEGEEQLAEMADSIDEAVGEGMVGAARNWGRRHLRTHFEREGHSKYQYDRRSNLSYALKRKQQGHSDPNTFSGDARDMAVGSFAAKKLRSGVVEASFRVPAYMEHNKHRGERVKELTTITDAEFAEMDEIAGTKAVEKLEETT